MAYTSDDFWAQHDAMAKTGSAPKTGNDFWAQHDAMAKVNSAPKTNTPSKPTGILTREQLKADRARRLANPSPQVQAVRSKLLQVPVAQLGKSGAPQTFDKQNQTVAYVPKSTVAQNPNRYVSYTNSAKGPVAGPPINTGTAPNPAPNPTPNPAPNPAPAPTTALTREVQPQDTVAEQLDRLLKSDSPYLEQARLGAIEQANARGLLNSSLAAGAGEAAAIRAALPIVTQDASTYFTQGRDNQAAINQFRFNQQTSDLNAELARLNTSLNTDSASRLSRLNNDLAMTRDNQNFGFQQQLQQGQFQNNRALQSDQFGQNKALQSDQIASNERMRALDIEAQDRARQEDFEHGVVSGVSNAVIKNNERASNNISAIYANPGLTPEQHENGVKIEIQNRDTNNQFLYDLGDSILGWSYDWFSLTDGQ